MFLREAPTQTLKDVREQVDEKLEAVQVSNSEIAVDLTGESKSFKIGTVEVPVTDTGIQALGSHLDVPGKFLMRQDAELQEYLLKQLLARTQGTVTVLLNDQGISTLRDPNAKIIAPAKLVEAAIKTIDESAPVVETWRTVDEFRLDTIAPEGFERGHGGDRRVGDITTGGLRIGLKTGQAPWVQQFMYRLACTNGYEVADEGLKVDARGSSVEEVLAEFEAAADRAFRSVENTIASFYELRNQTVENPERTLIRMAEERGLPDRTVLAMAERVPAMAQGGDGVSMFDIVNLITNQANEPTIRGRANSRRALELAGGTIVAEHVDRCSHCQSRLTS